MYWTFSFSKGFLDTNFLLLMSEGQWFDPQNGNNKYVEQWLRLQAVPRVRSGQCQNKKQTHLNIIFLVSNPGRGSIQKYFTNFLRTDEVPNHEHV